MDLLIILVVVLLVVLVWRGPTMLPRLGAAFGRTVKDVRENLPGTRKDEGTEAAEPRDEPRA